MNISKHTQANNIYIIIHIYMNDDLIVISNRFENLVECILMSYSYILFCHLPFSHVRKLYYLQSIVAFQGPAIKIRSYVKCFLLCELLIFWLLQCSLICFSSISCQQMHNIINIIILSCTLFTFLCYIRFRQLPCVLTSISVCVCWEQATAGF